MVSAEVESWRAVGGVLEANEGLQTKSDVRGCQEAEGASCLTKEI